MAFVKDAVLDGFKRDVELNFNALEERVIELEKLLKKSTGGVTVDAVVPEPEPEVVEEEEVVEEVTKDVTDEYGQPLSEKDKKEDSSPKSKPKKKK
tara:strand:+ start:26 stop:313 length:288 start_codon:yes stop_codon:yes gene_type:complete